METSKILTASLLDLLFDNRNKDYGAYELRKTYQERIIKSLLITITIAGIAYAVSVLASRISHQKERYKTIPGVIVEDLPEIKPEKVPEPKKQSEPQVRTEIFTPPKIMPTDEISKPLPTQDDLDSSKFGLIKQDGIVDNGLTEITKLDDGKGIIDNNRTEKNDEPVWSVQVEAKYNGNWENFLRRNLRPEVPVDNGAPAGRYTIIIQFIVDVDGTVSAITPITHLGYGMEDEAIRVLKKADKWEPAFQNGIHVKAYRRQPITFEVMTDD